MSSTVQQAVKTLSDQTKQLFFISLRTSYLIATFTRKRKKGSMDPPCPLQIHGNGESPHQYNRPPTMLSAICICTISQNRVRNRLSAVSSKPANFQCIFLLRKEKYISFFNRHGKFEPADFKFNFTFAKLVLVFEIMHIVII